MSQENSENSKLLDNVLGVLHCEQTAKCHISTVGLLHKILCMQRNALIQEKCPKIHWQGWPALKVKHIT